MTAKRYICQGCGHLVGSHVPFPSAYGKIPCIAHGCMCRDYVPPTKPQREANP